MECSAVSCCWEEVEGDELVESDAAGSATGRAFGADVCILRRLECRLPPSRRRYVQYAGDLCCLKILTSTASGAGTRRHGFIVMKGKSPPAEERRKNNKYLLVGCCTMTEYIGRKSTI